MGVVRNITFTKMPKQTGRLNSAVSICYHYNPECSHEGFIVRDDAEEPYVTIIYIPSLKLMGCKVKSSKSSEDINDDHLIEVTVTPGSSSLAHSLIDRIIR